MLYFFKVIQARYRGWQSKNFEKTKYGKKIRKLKDSHKGERCFIVANGPSLTTTDLEKLYQTHQITFAMNRIYKIFDKTNWRPSYYVCEDVNIFHESINAINAIPALKKFIPINHKWYNGIEINNALYFWANYNRDLDYPDSFSTDISKQMDSMGTVTFTCINIAVFMGFSDIYLIGVDHNYHVTIDESGKEVVDENAKDYFCEDYDLDIQKVVIHDMGQNTRAYRKAKHYCDKNNIRVFNATRGGKLEIFPRVDFDRLF